ncbi:WDR6 [Candida pseudojiufengensis]|uniref:WDR6 n=1 Tax=Candida pseudojiufengensis TaxID=497109 RepID=UPI002225421B|nr:WDR6 [Candida pseudojiufengensis]KAI5963137.1 WDR6 [Candida pseudojiufengensis]
MTINNEISSLNEDKFKTIQHYGPVTCIKIFKNYVFVGYGPILYIYQFSFSDSPELNFVKQIFKRNKIHNIYINESQSKVIISGSKSYTVIDFEDLEPFMIFGKSHYSNFKIEEKSINEWIITSCILDDGTILLLNSYNEIYQIQSNYITKIHCGEKSILYSGSINILENGEIFIASGTVMNGIIIWSYNTEKIKYRLKDHEGSIFGVKIDKFGKYIISCSDDRSIKLYNFKTGKLLSTGWGHGSRIWNLEFMIPLNIDEDDKSNIKIMSIGEDCTLRIWENDPGSDKLKSLKVIENCHRGKHIWSGDVQYTNKDRYEDYQNLKICCTGGADGRVRIHDLDEKNQLTTKLTVTDFINNLNLQIDLKNISIKDYFYLIYLNKLICLTSNGLILEYDYKSKKYRKLAQFDDFTNGMVNGFINANTVLIADKNGKLLSISYTNDDIHLNWYENEDIKISNIYVIDDSVMFYILFEPSNPNFPFILKQYFFENNQLNLQNFKNISRPNNNFQLTSFTIDFENEWIILTSKKMSLLIVDLLDLSIKCFKRKIAPGDTISSVSVINTTSKFINLLILSRDGTYLITKIFKNFENTNFEIEILLENKLTRGLIEGGFIYNNNLLLYGFKSSYFFVWNETKQIEIMNEICGGNGHRHFKFYFEPRMLNKFKFIYSFKNDLYLCDYYGRFIDQNIDKDFGILHRGTHGREIRDLSISKQEFTDNSRLMVTSSEDSTIGINKIYSDGEIENFWNMNNHISGMQKIKFLNNNYILSSAANEEFLIWKLSFFKNDIPTVRELKRLSLTQEIPDLRIMDFDGIEYENYIFLITVYSNSTIKFWNFSKVTETFELINKFNYSTCCILNCEIFEINKNKYLIISATDGYILIWNINDPKNIQLEIKQKLHQSGVKAICLAQLKNNFYLITGGDDNSLTSSQIIVNDSKLKLINLQEELNAASATITSISHFDNYVIVVSVDQIVRLWTFNPNLKCIAAKYTTVADVGCCDITTINNEKILIIGGSGLSSWKINI